MAVCLLLGNTWLLEPLQPQELVDENVLWSPVLCGLRLGTSSELVSSGSVAVAGGTEVT